MDTCTVDAYEPLIRQRVSDKVRDFHDAQDCCQECRVKVWQALVRYSDAASNGMSVVNWVGLQIDAAINSFLRDTYYTERARREIPAGTVFDMEVLLAIQIDEGAGEATPSLQGLGFEDRGPDREFFRRWTTSLEREEADLRDLEEEILSLLTTEQMEIYELLKAGYTQREIAARLNHGRMSQPAVHKQIKKIRTLVIKSVARREYR